MDASVLCLCGVGADELSNFLDCLLSFLEHRRESLEDVNHVFPRLERDLDARFARAFGQPRRVIHQRFRSANLNQQRRQPRKVGIQRRRERMATIAP